jgi:hypothetical protein
VLENALRGAGGGASGAAMGGSTGGVLGNASRETGGISTVYADETGGTLGRRSRGGGSWFCAEVWKGNTDEALSAAKLLRPESGLSVAGGFARNGNAGSAGKDDTPVSVRPGLLVFPDCEGGSTTGVFGDFSAGLFMIVVTSSSLAARLCCLGGCGVNGRVGALTGRLMTLCTAVFSSVSIDVFSLRALAGAATTLEGGRNGKDDGLIGKPGAKGNVISWSPLIDIISRR